MDVWQQFANRLTELLDLKLRPVAVSYTDTAPEGAWQRPVRVCTALKMAAGGQVVDLTAKTSACPGGSYYLGLIERSPDRIPAVRDFLVNGEKIFADAVALHRALRLTEAKPPTGLAEHVVLGPLDRASAEPDLVVFICDCSQAARLVALAYYFDGLPMHCDPSGSMCMSAITYPLVTGRFNITLGDVAARQLEDFGPGEMLVSVPWEMMGDIVAAIDKSSAGTAKIEFPEAMRRGRDRGQDGGRPH